jgi:hypothetical protein
VARRRFFRLGGAVALASGACLVVGVLLAVGGFWRDDPVQQHLRPDPPRGVAIPGGQAPTEENRRATVGPDRRRHILDGDRTGGGHRPGSGAPGKSEFPFGWSDDKIIAAIEDVANSPASIRTLGRDNRTVVDGTREGVNIRVIIGSDGRTVITGYPTNAPRNARPPG